MKTKDREGTIEIGLLGQSRALETAEDSDEEDYYEETAHSNVCLPRCILAHRADIRKDHQDQVEQEHHLYEENASDSPEEDGAWRRPEVLKIP